MVDTLRRRPQSHSLPPLLTRLWFCLALLRRRLPCLLLVLLPFFILHRLLLPHAPHYGYHRHHLPRLPVSSLPQSHLQTPKTQYSLNASLNFMLCVPKRPWLPLLQHTTAKIARLARRPTSTPFALLFAFRPSNMHTRCLARAIQDSSSICGSMGPTKPLSLEAGEVEPHKRHASGATTNSSSRTTDSL